jgi:UrcA family protein
MGITINLKAAAIVATIAAPLAFAATPASAQDGQIVVRAPAPDVRAEIVRYRDLNLLTRDGEWALHRRVSGAVERVCLYDEGVWYGLAVPDYNQCADRAWRGARPQMSQAIYRARQYAYYRH